MSAVTAGAFAARLVKHVLPDTSTREDARAEATDIVARARREAGMILDAAQRDAAKLRADTEAASRAAVDRAVAAKLIESRAALDAEMAGLRPVLAGLLRRALEKLVRASCGDDVLGRLVERALDDLSETVSLRITVNPADAEAVRRTLEARAGAARRCALVADPEQPVGAARLDAAGMRVDLGLDAQTALFERVVAGTA